ncbi:MAG: hypothetical protein ABI767_13605 [Rhodanobacter sp.]
MIFRTKTKKVASTPFSDFIRNASSAEKKKVYKVVLQKATERQQLILTKAASAR